MILNFLWLSSDFIQCTLWSINFYFTMKTHIWDDDSLSLFLQSPDIFSSHISIVIIGIYESIERCTVVQEPTKDEYDLRGTTYLSSLNIDFSGGLIQQPKIIGFERHSNDICNSSTQHDSVAAMHYHNFDWNSRIMKELDLVNLPRTCRIWIRLVGTLYNKMKMIYVG